MSAAIVGGYSCSTSRFGQVGCSSDCTLRSAGPGFMVAGGRIPGPHLEPIMSHQPESTPPQEPTSPEAPSQDGLAQIIPGRVGRYRIEGEIARGGMGMVLRGQDGDLNRTLAVKVLLAKHRGRADLERRF